MKSTYPVIECSQINILKANNEVRMRSIIIQIAIVHQRYNESKTLAHLRYTNIPKLLTVFIQ